MTIAILDTGRLEIQELAQEGDTADLIRSYVSLHNDLLETKEWMRSRQIGVERGAELRSLCIVAQALDAGFDPFTPPPTWFNGPLAQYTGSIPEHVRVKIDIALPIFGAGLIIVHDPRPDTFRRAVDPIVTGHVILGQRDQHFLIAQWDLDQDLKYLGEEAGPEGSSEDQIRKALGEVSQRWTGGA